MIFTFYLYKVRVYKSEEEGESKTNMISEAQNCTISKNKF